MKPPKPVEWEVDEKNCWNCTSHAPDTSGYPRASRNGKMVRLYREAYEQNFGPVPSGEVVRHTCDNNRCINPAHLTAGTQLQNVQDRVERNRSARFDKNGRAKLTPENVRLVRTSQKGGSQLARELDVSPGLISRIRSREVWGDLPD